MPPTTSAEEITSVTAAEADAEGQNGEEKWSEYDELELVVQGREIVVSEKVLCSHSKYFAHVFGRLRPDDGDTVVLKRGPSLEEDADEQYREEEEEEEEMEQPLTMISYATMRTIVDLMEGGALKVSQYMRGQSASKLLPDSKFGRWATRMCGHYWRPPTCWPFRPWSKSASPSSPPRPSAWPIASGVTCWPTP